MWLVKRAANKVYAISQNVLKERSEVERQIDDIISNRHEVMPIRKMGELANSSYDIQAFEKIVDLLAEKLTEIKYERKSLKKRLNLLVLVTYLIKYGASGFIDEFRTMIDGTFKRYENMLNFVAEDDPQMRATMQEIRERARYIRALLFDTSALLREKEVARLIKEKLFVQNGDYAAFQRQPEEQAATTSDRIDGFLEHYVWRYTQKIDQKLDKITDLLIAKIDQYLDGDMSESFEIDEAEMSSMKPSTSRSEFELGGAAIQREEVRFIENKLVIKEEEVLEGEKMEIDNLLELEPRKEEDLIDFE
jgi:hypothetical protein